MEYILQIHVHSITFSSTSHFIFNHLTSKLGIISPLIAPLEQIQNNAKYLFNKLGLFYDFRDMCLHVLKEYFQIKILLLQ